ncbi:MAG: Fic family protein [Gammaproteobacteria bacterium]
MPASARRTGRHAIQSYGGEKVRAFIPSPLPPRPPLRLAPLYALMEEASRALGRLDGMSATLPDPHLFTYMYVRKEAVLSAQIEGTQSSLADLLRFEAKQRFDAPLDDVREASLYVGALDYGIAQLRSGMPFSNRLLREVHAQLLTRGRGSDKNPGEFRRSQNWVGGTRPGNAAFVPPPPHEVETCMSDLEKFIHRQNAAMPPLLKAALAHVQFETIHPFLDGNGRLGRMLISFLLQAEGALQQPVLYLSLFLKNRRAQYYDLLQRVRERGDWEAWVHFFLSGVLDTSQQAGASARRILELCAADRRRITERGGAASALRIHDHMKKHPVISVPAAAAALRLSAPTVYKAIVQLAELNIIAETTGKRRGQIFAYRRYLEILAEGTEPL